MKPVRLAIVILISVLIFSVIGCATDEDHLNKPYAGTDAKEVEKEDGSTVAVTQSPDGTKTEVRTFKTGEVARVTRTTRPNGEQTARVEFRDDRNVDIEDKSTVEDIMDATANTIADAANKTWDTTKHVGEEVGDKSEDVADKTVDTSKDVGKAIGKGAKKGAEKVGKGVKKIGEKIKD